MQRSVSMWLENPLHLLLELLHLPYLKWSACTHTWIWHSTEIYQGTQIHHAYTQSMLVTTTLHDLSFLHASPWFKVHASTRIEPRYNYSFKIYSGTIGECSSSDFLQPLSRFFLLQPFFFMFCCLVSLSLSHMFSLSSNSLLLQRAIQMLFRLGFLSKLS